MFKTIVLVNFDGLVSKDEIRNLKAYRMQGFNFFLNSFIVRFLDLIKTKLPKLRFLRPLNPYYLWLIGKISFSVCFRKFQGALVRSYRRGVGRKPIVLTFMRYYVVQLWWKLKIVKICTWGREREALSKGTARKRFCGRSRTVSIRTPNLAIRMPTSSVRCVTLSCARR